MVVTIPLIYLLPTANLLYTVQYDIISRTPSAPFTATLSSCQADTRYQPPPQTHPPSPPHLAAKHLAALPRQQHVVLNAHANATVWAVTRLVWDV